MTVGEHRADLAPFTCSCLALSGAIIITFGSYIQRIGLATTLELDQDLTTLDRPHSLPEIKRVVDRIKPNIQRY